MWSPTSARAKRTSGARKFRSPTEKDFFNTIGTKRTWRDVRSESAFAFDAVDGSSTGT
jgi:hypothetical protein